MLDIISGMTGVKKLRHTLPMWLAQATAPMSEAYYSLKRQPPLYTSYSLYTLRSNSNFSNSKAKALLGFAPRDIHDTLLSTLDFLRSQGRISYPA